MKRHVVALTVWMLAAAVLGFGTLVLLSDESVGYAVGLTIFATLIAYVGMLFWVRRYGHL